MRDLSPGSTATSPTRRAGRFAAIFALALAGCGSAEAPASESLSHFRLASDADFIAPDNCWDGSGTFSDAYRFNPNKAGCSLHKGASECVFRYVAGEGTGFEILGADLTQVFQIGGCRFEGYVDAAYPAVRITGLGSFSALRLGRGWAEAPGNVFQGNARAIQIEDVPFGDFGSYIDVVGNSFGAAGSENEIAIGIANASGIEIRDNAFHQNGTGIAVGDGAVAVSVNGNVFDGARRALEISSGAAYVTVASNTVRSAERGLHGGGFGPVIHCNRFESCGDGVHLAGASGARVYDNQFVGTLGLPVYSEPGDPELNQFDEADWPCSRRGNYYGGWSGGAPSVGSDGCPATSSAPFAVPGGAGYADQAPILYEQDAFFGCSDSAIDGSEPRSLSVAAMRAIAWSALNVRYEFGGTSWSRAGRETGGMRWPGADQLDDCVDPSSTTCQSEYWSSAFGVDCSGFVDKVWQLPRTHSISGVLPGADRYTSTEYACWGAGSGFPEIPTYGSGNPFWKREPVGQHAALAGDVIATSVFCGGAGEHVLFVDTDEDVNGQFYVIEAAFPVVQRRRTNLAGLGALVCPPEAPDYPCAGTWYRLTRQNP